MPISNAVSASRVARIVGVEEIFIDLRAGAVIYLPPRIAILAQGNTAAVFATTPLVLTAGAGEAATVYGYGSQIHDIAAALMPATGDGTGSTPVTVYPTADGTVVAAGTVTPVGVPTGAFALQARIGGTLAQSVEVPAGASVADMCALLATAVNGTLAIPVVAVDGTTVVDLTAKYKGPAGNAISIEVTGGESVGTAFTIGAMAAGSGAPSAVAPLAQMGTVWENIVVHGYLSTDTAALDAIKAHGDGRYGATIKAPYVALMVDTGEVAATLIALGDARKGDRINALIAAPGAPDRPWQYAARAARRVAQKMDSSPAFDYARQEFNGFRPGDASVQFDSDQRDLLVKAGIGTTEVTSGVVTMSDTVTFYHPDDEAIPGSRYVVDLVRLFNCIFTSRLIFERADWDGAPLARNETPTDDPDIKKPKMAVTDLAAATDALAKAGLLDQPEVIKAGIRAGINGVNPKRLDWSWPVIFSGNTNIVSGSILWGFSFAPSA